MKAWLPMISVTAALLFGFNPEIFAQSGNLYNQLVEMAKSEIAKKGGKVTIAINWTNPQGKAIVEEFKKDFSFIKEGKFERVRTVEESQRALMEFKAGRPQQIDVTMVSDESWPAYQEAGAFLKPPFEYEKLAKALPSGWPALDPRVIDPQGYFLSTTGAVRGIAYNKNLVSADKAPKKWEDCNDPMWRGKVLYDPRPKLTALQHDPKTREAHLKWLRGLLDNKVVLNRGMDENLQKIAAGEFPINCAANYHNALPMIDEGAPIGFVLPDPIPLELGTQMFVTKWTLPATTQLFALWAATKAQPVVEKSGYRGFPWDPTSRKYPMAQKKYIAVCGPDCLRLSGEKYDQEHARILKLPGAQ
jgi:ABC-type Fe3+ transport system substrate-binding protein